VRAFKPSASARWASSMVAAIVPGGVKAKPTGVGFAAGLDPACLGGVGPGRKRRDSWSDRLSERYPPGRRTVGPWPTLIYLALRSGHSRVATMTATSIARASGRRGAERCYASASPPDSLIRNRSTCACFPGDVRRNVRGWVEPERPFDVRVSNISGPTPRPAHGGRGPRSGGRGSGTRGRGHLRLPLRYSRDGLYPASGIDRPVRRHPAGKCRYGPSTRSAGRPFCQREDVIL
jgi:hypothetical protein